MEAANRSTILVFRNAASGAKSPVWVIGAVTASGAAVTAVGTSSVVGVGAGLSAELGAVVLVGTSETVLVLVVAGGSFAQPTNSRINQEIMVPSSWRGS